VIKDQYDLGNKFKKLVVARGGLDNYGGMSATSAEGTTHTVRKEEQVAFSNWINRCKIILECRKKHVSLASATFMTFIYMT